MIWTFRVCFFPLWMCVCEGNTTVWETCSKTLAMTACCLPMNFKSTPTVRERRGRARKSGRPGQCSLPTAITEPRVHSGAGISTCRVLIWRLQVCSGDVSIKYFLPTLCPLVFQSDTHLLKCISNVYNNRLLNLQHVWYFHPFLDGHLSTTVVSVADIKLSALGFLSEQNFTFILNGRANAVKVLLTATMSSTSVIHYVISRLFSLVLKTEGWRCNLPPWNMFTA